MLKEITDLLQPATEVVELGGRKIIFTEVPIDHPADEFFEKDVGNLNLLIASARDEQGAPIFTADDIPALRKMGATKMRKLLATALKVNGFWLEENEKK